MIENKLYVYMNEYCSTILGLGKRRLTKKEYQFLKLLIVNSGKCKQILMLYLNCTIREDEESDGRKESERTHNSFR